MIGDARSCRAAEIRPEVEGIGGHGAFTCSASPIEHLPDLGLLIVGEVPHSGDVAVWHGHEMTGRVREPVEDGEDVVASLENERGSIVVVGKRTEHAITAVHDVGTLDVRGPPTGPEDVHEAEPRPRTQRRRLPRRHMAYQYGRMQLERASGVLLHPTSLPGPDGIGDLGPGVRRWLDWLASTGCRYWQLLPLGPTGYGDSPYQCFSAVAGNPYLVSAADLVDDGLLRPDDLADRPDLRHDRVDYGPAIAWKLRLLDRAFQRFVLDRPEDMGQAFGAFRRTHASWLDDYALFMAIKEECGGGSWLGWLESIRHRDPDALDGLRDRLSPEIDRHAFRQFLFFRQWSAVRHAVTNAGMAIIGDAPIFVAMDSADVWANPQLFDLDEDLRPNHVAGVPPDYFSETGQLWGNPLYRWDVHATQDYSWWIERLRMLGLLVDVVRIDHFRGFVDYWEIPADAETAINGRWVDGPGKQFFDVVGGALGGLGIIAEDLGELHPAVPQLRDELGLPGMKILQFAYDGDPDNEFLPRHYPENCVVYTGTHDNDTTRGWYASLSPHERHTIREMAGVDGRSIAQDLIRIGWESRAKLAIAPLQDVLGLGSESRMNTPGVAAGNWSWRMGDRALTAVRAGRLGDLNRRTLRHRAG